MVYVFSAYLLQHIWGKWWSPFAINEYVSCQLRAKTVAGSEIILMNKAERSFVIMELNTSLEEMKEIMKKNKKNKKEIMTRILCEHILKYFICGGGEAL